MPHTHSIPDADTRQLPSFSLMQAVKRRFFAMRNGDLAAQMTAGGIGYKINFGLNLPQISDIATALRNGTLDGADHRPDATELAQTARLLWANSTTRESLLLAPMLIDPDTLPAAEATAMLAACPTTEVADVLCLKLLKRHPDAEAIATGLYGRADAGTLGRYGALRLTMNLLAMNRCDLATAREMAEAETARNETLTRRLARQILDEVEFLSEPD